MCLIQRALIEIPSSLLGWSSCWQAPACFPSELWTTWLDLLCWQPSQPRFTPKQWQHIWCCVCLLSYSRLVLWSVDLPGPARGHPSGPHQAPNSGTANHFLIRADSEVRRLALNPRTSHRWEQTKAPFGYVLTPYSPASLPLCSTPALDLFQENINSVERESTFTLSFISILETSLHMPGTGQVVKNQDLTISSYLAL